MYAPLAGEPIAWSCWNASDVENLQGHTEQNQKQFFTIVMWTQYRRTIFLGLMETASFAAPIFHFRKVLTNRANSGESVRFGLKINVLFEGYLSIIMRWTEYLDLCEMLSYRHSNGAAQNTQQDPVGARSKTCQEGGTQGITPCTVPSATSHFLQWLSMQTLTVQPVVRNSLSSNVQVST